jgi:hypothetical protein
MQVFPFAGFKIQNSIKAYDNMYLAETLALCRTKEDVAMQVINYYASLYKAKTVELLKENQKCNNVWMIFLIEKMESFLEMIC